MRRPELLIPASSLEVLKIAVIYGADAVYIGGEAFGLRAKAKNFSMEEIREGIAFAHAHDVKVYITANILAHNGDLDGVREYFAELREIKPDALIISDPGVYMIAKEVCPEIERHISTQANNTNYGTYRFWYEQGAKRVVSARELSLAEIKEIRANIPDLLTTLIPPGKTVCCSLKCRLLQTLLLHIVQKQIQLFSALVDGEDVLSSQIIVKILYTTVNLFPDISRCLTRMNLQFIQLLQSFFQFLF